MMSIWRLQSIVETRATTLPTFDPTWYGPTPIVLSCMEISLATMCASLPVFWPVIKKSLGPYIMVTHEVKITRESRYGPGSSRPRLRTAAGDVVDDDDDDNVELRQQTSDETTTTTMMMEGGGDMGSSVTRLDEVHRTSEQVYDKRDHYRDSFTKQQVLGQESTLGRVTSVRVRCESRTDNRSKELKIML